MLGEVIYWTLNMNIVASFMGLLILPIRKIKRMPRRIALLLWIIPFVRMWVLLGLNSHYSLMTIVSRWTTKTVSVLQTPEGIELSMVNSLMAASSYFPIT